MVKKSPENTSLDPNSASKSEKVEETAERAKVLVEKTLSQALYLMYISSTK